MLFRASVSMVCERTCMIIRMGEFIAQVIKKAYDEGREDALLDFMFTENEMIYDKFFKAEEESKTKKL